MEGGEDIQDTAATQCEFDYTPPGTLGPCPMDPLVNHSNMHRYSPCDLAQLPICSPGAAVSPYAVPEDEEEEDGDRGKYVVGGLLGLLLVGGIAYAVTRKKKKKKKKGRR